MQLKALAGILVLALSTSACEDTVYQVERGVGARDGAGSRLDGRPSWPDGTGQRDGGGPRQDVAQINDDTGAPAVDRGTPGDLCVAPSRCSVAFSFAKQGDEQSAEVRGNFGPGSAYGWDVGLPMVLNGSTWEATIEIADGTRVTYKFVTDPADTQKAKWYADPQNPDSEDDTFGGRNSVLTVHCEDLCGDVGVSPQPDQGVQPSGGFAWQDAVMYFALVDRFYDSDKKDVAEAPKDTDFAANYQGGDLPGITQKINEGYFSDLGVNVIWISSPVDNAEGKWAGIDPGDPHKYTAYHGYWPKNLQQVEDKIGTMQDLKALVAAAHAKGIRVVMDYVMNHVHESSPIWTDNRAYFNQNPCLCGQQCSWDGAEGEYCWFTSYLPDFDFYNDTARKFSIDNAVWWIEQAGVDGYRLDAVKHINIQWVKDLRSRINQLGLKEHFYMVGETFTGDKGVIKKYVGPDMLDGQFDFPLRLSLLDNLVSRKGKMSDLKNAIAGNLGFYDQGSWKSIMGTFLGNHDVPRTVHFASGTYDNPWESGKGQSWSNQPAQPADAAPYERLGAAFSLLLCMPGMPLIYYGDEIGLAGGGDPDNRRFMRWDLDASKTPDKHMVALRTQISKVAKLRAKYKALSRGVPETLQDSDADVWAYRMSYGSESVVVIVNRADSEKTVNLGGNFVDLLNGESAVDGGAIKVAPRSVRILK